MPNLEAGIEPKHHPGVHAPVLFLVALVGAALAWMPTSYSMVWRWMGSAGYYSHGILVPLPVRESGLILRKTHILAVEYQPVSVIQVISLLERHGSGRCVLEELARASHLPTVAAPPALTGTLGNNKSVVQLVEILAHAHIARWIEASKLCPAAI